MASIYQRARPSRFGEVVGQEHVKDVLLAALRRGAVGHAYLFSGPRGVGKTTTARLLAMAVNCEAEVAERPCGVCESCRLVRSGDHPDVIELDAASNNSVDDVRDLREHVRLASLRGGRRVWVLDEAHMLSRAAANALLKTLEEPPPGLVFILATTEPEKLPPTVLSRCQHFRFRRLSTEQIASKLARIAADAGVAAEPAALTLVARSADGAMRDAESMLERLLIEGTHVTLAQAEAALGLPPAERLRSLARHLLSGAWDGLLLEAGEAYAEGFAPRTVAERLGRTLRDDLFEAVTTKGGEGAAALVRAIDALDEQSERFVRQGDLYALEVTLLRASAAALGASGAAAEVRGPAVVEPQPGRSVSGEGVAAPRSAAPPPDDAGAPSVPDFDPHARPSAPRPRPSRGEPPAGTPASTPPRSTAGASASPSNAARANVAGAFDPRQVMIAAGTQLKAFLQPATLTVDASTLLVRWSDTHGFHFGQLRKRAAEFLAVIDGLGGAALTVILEGPGGRDRLPARAVGEASVDAAQPDPPAPAESRGSDAQRVAPESRVRPVAVVDPRPPPSPANAPADPPAHDDAGWVDGDDEPPRPEGIGLPPEAQGAVLLLAQAFPGRVQRFVTDPSDAPSAEDAGFDDAVGAPETSEP